MPAQLPPDGAITLPTCRFFLPGKENLFLNQWFRWRKKEQNGFCEIFILHFYWECVPCLRAILEPFDSMSVLKVGTIDVLFLCVSMVERFFLS